MWEIVKLFTEPHNWRALIAFLVGVGLVYTYARRQLNKQAKDLKNQREQAIEEGKAEQRRESQQSYHLNGLEDDIQGMRKQISQIQNKARKIPQIAERVNNLTNRTNHQGEKIDQLSQKIANNTQSTTKTATKLDDLIDALNGFDKKNN